MDKDFKDEPYLCNGCHDLMQKTMNFTDAPIVSIKLNDYRIHFWHMSKDDAINIMKDCDLNQIIISFLHYIKMSETTYYQRNREIILNRAKEYENNKEILKEQTRNKYRELSGKEKI